MEFKPMPKMARLSREVVITEKIDGTNASIFIWNAADEQYNGTPVTAGVGNLHIAAGSRTRWITPEDDNFGFARWVRENADELVKLGEGHHFGEWWGAGIQRTYGLAHRRFSLFNVGRWGDELRAVEGEPTPTCCHVVPVLYRGPFADYCAQRELDILGNTGSVAAPGFMKPEGVVLYHTAANVLFKKTLDGDGTEKSKPKERPAKEKTVRNPNVGGRRKGPQPTFAGPFRRSTDVASMV